MYEHTAWPTVSWGGTGIAAQPATRRALDYHAPARLYVAGRCSRSAGILCDVLSRLPATGRHGQVWVRNRISWAHVSL